MSPAPASVRQICRLGTEVSFGAGGAVTRQPASFGLAPSENVETGSVTVPGSLYPSKSWTSYEDAAFSIEEGTLSYDELVIPLSSVMQKVTPTTPSGATNARLWTFVSSQWQAQAFQSYVAEVGDLAADRGGKSGAMFFTEVGFEVDPTNELVGLTGSGMGKRLGTEGMTETGVTTQDYEPILPGHFNLSVADDPDDLGDPANIVDSAFICGFSLGDRRNVVRYIGRANAGTYSDVVETIPSTEVPLTIADKASSPVDDLTAWAREGRTVFVRLEAVSPRVIEMSTGGTPVEIPFKATFDFACGLTDKSREETQEVASKNFTYQFVNDPVFGAYKVQLQNDRTAIL